MKLSRFNKASERYGVPMDTFKTWMRRGLLTKHKLGRSTFVDEDELLDRIRTHTAADRERRSARQAATEPAPTLEAIA